MDQIKIGEFIAEQRKAQGMSQKELADKIGVTNKAVSKWETGKGLPDVSIYNSLCEALNISLNEFFAGERIPEEVITEKYDRNLEEILKEYYKMKKQKQIIQTVGLIITIVLSSILLRYILIFGVLGLFEFTATTEISSDIRYYDKNAIIESYQGDLDSNLSIFPDAVPENAQNVEYTSSFRTGVFDTDAIIFLKYTLDEEMFRAEEDRLSGLSLTIKNNTGESWKNDVLYDDASYYLPAYITKDGFGNTYEYALMDDDANTITYIYLAYPSKESLDYQYLKKNTDEYENMSADEEWNSYDMYSHSFDGGESKLEFSDNK